MTTAKGKASVEEVPRSTARVSTKYYERELVRPHVELVKQQEFIRAKGLRVVLIFEGRDAAGKGGAIQRITEPLNPRYARVVALPAPTDRERGQWYLQRYVPHLPARGEMVLFDRSWYNGAGVERVMGFCTDEEYWEFLRCCPEFERMLVRGGIQLIKYWFSVSDTEQERRFQQRLTDPTKRWKLSPMDLEARNRWEDFSRAKDAMLAATDIPEAPWWVVEAEVKKRPAQRHQPSAHRGAVRGPHPQAAQAAAPATGARRLHPAAQGEPPLRARRRPRLMNVRPPAGLGRVLGGRLEPGLAAPAMPPLPVPVASPFRLSPA